MLIRKKRNVGELLCACLLKPCRSRVIQIGTVTEGRFFSLFSGKHNDQVKVIVILNIFRQFIGIGAGMIDINLNNIKQFIFF